MNFTELPYTKVIPGNGKKTSTIAVVGDSPGRNEESERKPFAGFNERTLQSLLFKANILWDDCYKTNVIKERPSNIEDFIKFKKKEVLHMGTFNKYLDLLKEELLEIKPNAVLAVGNIALYALTSKQGITAWRGSVLESTLIPGLKVIPAIAPYAIIRQYLYQYYVFADVQRLKKESITPEIIRPEYNYITDPTLEQVYQYLEQCKTSKLLSFDIEVGGFKHGLSEVSCISFSKDQKSSISIPFSRSGVPRWSPENELEIWDTIDYLLRNEDIRKVAQNRFFDQHFLFRRYGIIVNNCEDTMIAHALIYPDFPKGLDFINSMFTDIGYYKADGKEFFGGRGNEEIFWLYSAKDSMVLSVAWGQLEQELKKRHLWETYQAQNGIVESLIFMTEHGMKIDIDGLTRKSAEAHEELIRLESKFYELVGRKINLRSSKQLQEYFYGNRRSGGLGLPPYKNKGKITTDESALLKLARPLESRPAVEEARILLEHRKLAKLRGTYYEMSYDTDGRIRSSMNPVGTRTGRLSSSENIFGTGTNAQNQPYALKEFHLIDEGYTGYEIDLSQAENRIVAYVAPEPKLIDAFEGGIDIHSRTASYIFGKHESEISKEDGSAPQFGNGEHSERFWGKKANHAFNYGQSANAFSAQMLISIGEAKLIFNAYHNAYAGVRKYHNMIKQMLQGDRTLTNLFGRKYLFLDRWDYSLFLAAYAFIPQSTIADIINRWGLLPIYNTMPEVVLLNQVHDSIFFQISNKVPYERHAELLLQIRDSLSQPLTWNGRAFVIPCDLKILPVNWMEGTELTLNHPELCQENLAQKIRQAVSEKTT